MDVVVRNEDNLPLYRSRRPKRVATADTRRAGASVPCWDYFHNIHDKAFYQLAAHSIESHLAPRKLPLTDCLPSTVPSAQGELVVPVRVPLPAIARMPAGCGCLQKADACEKRMPAGCGCPRYAEEPCLGPSVSFLCRIKLYTRPL